MLRTNHIVDVLKRHAGSALRFVGHSDDEYVILYIRDDVDTLYTGSSVEEIYDEYKSSRLASPYLQDVWDVGKHYSTIHAFEQATICQFIVDGEELIVSVDADSDVDLTAIMDACKSVLERGAV